MIHINGVSGPLPSANLLFLHVDLTVVPPEYIQVAEHYPVVINRSVTDISKPVFSELIISPNDTYHGPVIVKTKNNYGALPEMMMKFLGGKPQLKDIRQRRPWRWVEWLTYYPIFKSVNKVPPEIWHNKNLVVEKFLPERGGDGYFHVREWVFLGDREIHYMNISPEPVIKGENTVRREYLPDDEVPIELREIRNKLGFDYGKFDYAMHNGKAILYDINKTPGGPRDLSDRPGAIERVGQLGLGLECYMQRRSG